MLNEFFCTGNMGLDYKIRMYLQYLPIRLCHNALQPYKISSSQMHRFTPVVTIDSEARLNLVTHVLISIEISTMDLWTIAELHAI